MTANNRFGNLAQAAGKPCATEAADQAGSSPASALLAMHDAAAGPVALHAAPHAASPAAAASSPAASATSAKVVSNDKLQPGFPPLQLWGGCECTINRVGDQFLDQQRMNGGDERDDDMARVASLGIRTLRYPLLWEKIAPHGLAQADWRQSDERLAALRQRQIGVIAGLVHHGSGPAGTSLLDPGFGERLAVFADAVAARYPWIEDYTPVNEPLTTARFCGLYGVWYPHCKDDASFVRALLNQCRAVVLAMQAIRRHNPRARLVQTDDLGKTWSTPPLADVADFYNERRWLGWDLLCGKVDRGHPLWSWLLRAGARPQELLWFAQHRCPPDLIGVNYYITSERWLDHDPARFPGLRADTVCGRPCVDVEAVRAMPEPPPGIGPLLEEVWQRYGLPIAVTEAHLDAGREDQLRWLTEIWQSAEAVRARGVDLRAVTAWSLLGAFDWNSLVTRQDGYYESGAFDTRFSPPRPTAVARLLQQLAAGATAHAHTHATPAATVGPVAEGAEMEAAGEPQPYRHPAAGGRGWWRRPGRLTLQRERLVVAPPFDAVDEGPPILISGASGTLGRAFARICQQRNLAHVLLSRDEMDIAAPSSVERALDTWQPWAVINASGYVRVDEAERDVERCFRENAFGPAILAASCARHGVHLTTFSSDLVFDGRQHHPYVETDAVAPLNVYGRSKAEGEQLVLDSLPAAMVVRTSSFFGPWDEHNFLVKALRALLAGSPFAAPDDIIVSPTYVPDLVDVCLDLIIDGESGIWHLTNGQPLCWMELAHRAAVAARIDPSRLSARAARECNFLAPRPSYSALKSERAILLPALDNALDRFLAHHSAGASGGRSLHPEHH
jgi:dTDP-4-dehydrorhamnose reductase